MTEEQHLDVVPLHPEDPQGLSYMEAVDLQITEARIATQVLRNLGTTEAAKLIGPAPEGYKYEVHLVRVAEPLPPPPAPIPYDPAIKYEYRGLSCDQHGLQPHRRERDVTGPWTCAACAPAPTQP
jgi:hypothetical protein